ncbi:MAG TPA: hypothetical protein VIL20_06265 [Sandaracinaceae bacterium]
MLGSPFDPRNPYVPHDGVGWDFSRPNLPRVDPRWPAFPGRGPSLPSGPDGDDGRFERTDRPSPHAFGCTRTQGYWKTHFRAWPVTSLRLGAHTYTATEALALLWTSPQGDASLILAHQLIAALLNVASGADAIDAIARAQSWLETNGTVLAFGIHASQAPEAIDLADELAAYNEGRDGPGHCDDHGGGSGGSTPR